MYTCYLLTCDTLSRKIRNSYLVVLVHQVHRALLETQLVRRVQVLQSLRVVQVARVALLHPGILPVPSLLLSPGLLVGQCRLHLRGNLVFPSDPAVRRVQVDLQVLEARLRRLDLELRLVLEIRGYQGTQWLLVLQVDQGIQKDHLVRLPLFRTRNLQ